jgi:putative peptidoglycan lipid II flippase
VNSPPPGRPSPPSDPAAQRAEPAVGDAAPVADDGWSLPSIFGRAMVAGPHLQAEPELSELAGLSGIAADWPVEQWRAEAAAIEAAEDEALGRSRPGVIDEPPPLEPAPAPAASWPDLLPPPAPPQWSSTTYVGPTRLLPDEPPPAGLPLPAQREDDQAGAARSVLASSRTMAIASLASRITGFLRSIALVAALGTGLVSDAYNGANSFPNSVYELLLGGVLSSVLIPLLVHASEHDSDHGVAYTQRLLSIATSALAVTTLIAVALAPYIADIFVEAGPQRTLASTFATLLLPEIFFYGLGAMFVAVLNTRQIYGPGAWAPVANNVITIITVAIYLAVPGPAIPTPSSITNTQILVLGIGTTLGIVAQAFILVPSLRRAGFRWMWRFRGRPNEAGRLAQAARLSGWVLGYVAVSQVGVLVVTKVAFTFGDRYHHGVTTFTNADLLFQVPFGILGVSLLTAIMPRMARAASRNDKSSVIADINLGARLSSLALLPITVGLIVLGPAFTVVVFAHGKTAIGDARLIGDALAWSAFGLVPFAFVMLQLRVFYALREGRTPTLINIFMVGTKVVLVLLAEANLHGNAAVISLNVSTSASYVVGAVVGHFLLRRRMGPLGFRTVAIGVAQVGLACVAGGLAAYGLVAWCAGLFGHGRGGALTGLVSGSLVGLVVMGIVAWLLAIPEARQIGVRLGVKPRS